MNAEQRQLLDNMINVISAMRSSLAFLCTKTVNGVLPGKAKNDVPWQYYSYDACCSRQHKHGHVNEMGFHWRWSIVCIWKKKIVCKS